MKKYIIAITGASGVCYAKRLFDYLQPRAELHIVISDRGAELLNLELNINASYFEKENATVYKNSKMNASIASGSFKNDGMIIVPASMGTVGRVASGISGTLLERVADVALKEKRKMIIVPRETPLSSIHLRNLQILDQAGALILPACPGFYQEPKSMDDLVDFVVGRILDHLDIEQDLTQPYKP